MSTASFQAFWDYEGQKQLGTTRAEWSVSSEWSPDGCYFMTATTAPRLQVDNGYIDLIRSLFIYVIYFSGLGVHSLTSLNHPL